MKTIFQLLLLSVAAHVATSCSIFDWSCDANQWCDRGWPRNYCRTCRNINCAVGKYRSGSCGGTTNGYQCNTCSYLNCGTDQYRSGTCAGTVNGYQCNTCSNIDCSPGLTYRTGSCSGTTNGYQCVSCDNIECGNGYYRSGSCWGTYNGFRCNAYGCTTGSGTGCASCVSQSLRTSDRTCATCNPGYYVQDKACYAYGCSGGNCDTCVEQSRRTSSATCATCADGYYLSGTQCLPYGCSTSTSGNECETCVDQADRTSDRTCASCHPGYELQGTSCVPYDCETSRSGSGCKTCVTQLLRTSDATCSSCNDGYYLNNADHTCVAHGCVTDTSGTACASCVDQELRTSDTNCLTCNAGHYLSGQVCVAYGCQKENEYECRTCVDQEYRVDSTSCSSCFAGYYLDGLDCRPYDCVSTTSGAGCASCVNQTSRINNETCASCNRGYELNVQDHTCEPIGCDTTVCATCVPQEGRVSETTCATCQGELKCADLTGTCLTSYDISSPSGLDEARIPGNNISVVYESATCASNSSVSISVCKVDTNTSSNCLEVTQNNSHFQLIHDVPQRTGNDVSFEFEIAFDFIALPTMGSGYYRVMVSETSGSAKGYSENFLLQDTPPSAAESGADKGEVFMLSGLIVGGVVVLVLIVSFFMYRRYRKAKKRSEITLTKAEQQMQTLERRNIDDLAMEMTGMGDGDLVYDIETTAQGSGSGEEAALRARNEALARDNKRMKKELEKKELNSSMLDTLPSREIKSMDPEDELDL